MDAATPSSLSCASSTGAGAPVSGSKPEAVFGKAITSRIVSAPEALDDPVDQRRVLSCAWLSCVLLATSAHPSQHGAHVLVSLQQLLCARDVSSKSGPAPMVIATVTRLRAAIATRNGVPGAARSRASAAGLQNRPPTCVPSTAA